MQMVDLQVPTIGPCRPLHNHSDVPVAEEIPFDSVSCSTVLFVKSEKKIRATDITCLHRNTDSVTDACSTTPAMSRYR